MKLFLEHGLPRRIDYLRFFARVGRASFFLSVEGRDVQWFGRIESAARQPRFFTDREYSRYRLDHPVDQVLADDGEEVVVRTSDGAEERWLKPMWQLRRRRTPSANMSVEV